MSMDLTTNANLRLVTLAEEVANANFITVDELRGPARERCIVEARYLFASEAKRRGHPLSKIAFFLGRRCQSTLGRQLRARAAQ